MALRNEHKLIAILAFIALPATLWLAATEPALSQAPSNISDLAKVTGPNACAECHKEEAEVWKKTLHFRTFKSLPRSKEARAIANKMKIKRIKAKSLCLSCHFTTQIVRKKKKPIAGISCESCHAAGKSWEKLHSEFSGKTEKTESKAEAASRWKKTEKLGMIRPATTYKLAKNCYSCHVVPQERLVNIGGHPAGSPFELVSWSQGEVRHNVWYSKGKENTKANSGRKRILYIVGLAVELETALRAVGVATKRETYAFKMARRADVARKKIAAAAKAVPGAPEIAKIVTLGYSAGLKLKNKAALSAAADKIANQTLALIGKYDGSTFSGLDPLIPGERKYIGTPSK